MGKYIINLPDDEHLISWWTYTGTEDGKQHIDFREVVKTQYEEPDPEAIKQEAYQKGLSDARDAARKIAKLNTDEQKRLFGCFGIYFVAHEFSASEAIEKIRQYEEQEEIKVGIEVEARAGKAVIIEILREGKTVRYMYPDASTGVNDLCNLTLTGRYFPEIAEVFKKMKGEE